MVRCRPHFILDIKVWGRLEPNPLALNPNPLQILDYFSYEHFYVCYCNFWELDTDHDFLLDKEDLIKLGNYSLTYRVVDRIFAGAPRPVSSGVPDKLGYLDFIWLLLSEEDKNSDTAIR